MTYRLTLDNSPNLYSDAWVTFVYYLKCVLNEKIILEYSEDSYLLSPILKNLHLKRSPGQMQNDKFLSNLLR